MRPPNANGLSQDELARLERARQELQAVRRSMESLEMWDNAGYWSHQLREGEALLEIARLEFKARDPVDRQRNQREQRYKLLEICLDNQTAKRKIRRILARQMILANANNEKTGLQTRWAFLDFLVSMWSRTKWTGRSAFVRDLKRQYKGDIYANVWSVVTGELMARAEAKAAHIFPLQLGQAVMTYIFGPKAENEINSTRNGLFLPGAIKEAFDKHQVVVVPKDLSQPRTWKWMVIDKTGLWRNIATESITFGELHGRDLIFPDEVTRPRARYFYFHYLMAMLILGHKEPAAARELALVWTAQGPHLREGMIRAFVEGLKHMEPATEELIWAHLDDALPDPTGMMGECVEDAELTSETEGEIEADFTRRIDGIELQQRQWEEERDEKERDIGAALEDDWE